MRHYSYASVAVGLILGWGGNPSPAFGQQQSVNVTGNTQVLNGSKNISSTAFAPPTSSPLLKMQTTSPTIQQSAFAQQQQQIQNLQNQLTQQQSSNTAQLQELQKIESMISNPLNVPGTPQYTASPASASSSSQMQNLQQQLAQQQSISNAQQQELAKLESMISNPYASAIPQQPLAYGQVPQPQLNPYGGQPASYGAAMPQQPLAYGQVPPPPLNPYGGQPASYGAPYNTAMPQQPLAYGQVPLPQPNTYGQPIQPQPNPYAQPGVVPQPTTVTYNAAMPQQPLAYGQVPQSNPYGGQVDPYEDPTTLAAYGQFPQQTNPYGGQTINPYVQQPVNPYAAPQPYGQQTMNPYGSPQMYNAYGQPIQTTADQGVNLLETLALNAIQPPKTVGQPSYGAPMQQQQNPVYQVAPTQAPGASPTYQYAAAQTVTAPTYQASTPQFVSAPPPAPPIQQQVVSQQPTYQVTPPPTNVLDYSSDYSGNGSENVIDPNAAYSDPGDY